MVNNGAAAVLLVLAALAAGRGVACRGASWSRSAAGSGCPRSWRSRAPGWWRWAPPTAPGGPTTSGRWPPTRALGPACSRSTSRTTGSSASPRRSRSPTWPAGAAGGGRHRLGPARRRLPLAAPAARPRGWAASRPPARRCRPGPTWSRSPATSCSAARRPGIIAGRADLVAACAGHPLARALRPGGLVLAALQDLALAYLAGGAPTSRSGGWPTAPVAELRARARPRGSAAPGAASGRLASVPVAGRCPGSDPVGRGGRRRRPHGGGACGPGARRSSPGSTTARTIAGPAHGRSGRRRRAGHGAVLAEPGAAASAPASRPRYVVSGPWPDRSPPGPTGTERRGDARRRHRRPRRPREVDPGPAPSPAPTPTGGPRRRPGGSPSTSASPHRRCPRAGSWLRGRAGPRALPEEHAGRGRRRRRLPVRGGRHRGLEAAVRGAPAHPRAAGRRHGRRGADQGRPGRRRPGGAGPPRRGRARGRHVPRRTPRWSRSTPSPASASTAAGRARPARRGAPTAADRGRPRLWVDRAFAAKGSGTVVTGTLAGGSPGGRRRGAAAAPAADGAGPGAAEPTAAARPGGGPGTAWR